MKSNTQFGERTTRTIEFAVSVDTLKNNFLASSMNTLNSLGVKLKKSDEVMDVEIPWEALSSGEETAMVKITFEGNFPKEKEVYVKQVNG